MDVHGAKIACKHRNRVSSIFIMYSVVERMNLIIFIILFYNAGGGASPAFPPRLAFLWRETSWLTFLSYLLRCLVAQPMSVFIGDGLQNSQLQPISFFMIKLGRLSRDARMLMKGKPRVYFLEGGGWLSGCVPRNLCTCQPLLVQKFSFD